MQALASLIGALVAGEASQAIGRVRRKAAVYALAALALLCGAGFLVGAGFVAVARRIGTVEAALWFGGGFVLLALVVVGIDRLATRSRAKREARRRRDDARAVASAAAIALLPALLASRAGGLALVVPAAAALAYGVWRENAPRGDGRGGDRQD